ncbi:hypothetical protein [Flavobacterium anhuiense]|nr:hypothetical protein [Flavobacterium anhuiense]
MELIYSLTENDYLQQQLYLASKSEFVKKQRKKTKLLIILSLFMIGLGLYINKNKFEGYCFGSASVVFFFFFPLYFKKRHQFF